MPPNTTSSLTCSVSKHILINDTHPSRSLCMPAYGKHPDSQPVRKEEN
ncbi:hypothetical protein AA0116_g1557 [Alternaria tenuissima]|nr:hypothetical protein AA0116_g1557 [Alternaria tenuissima]